MSISVNGQSVVPPGFRFHPTEEELLTYYLKKKVASERMDLDVIRDVDLNKLEPWDIQEKCRIGSGPQNDWYLFSHKDKKYPTGTRTNRATAAGFWKATGRDKAIYSCTRRIGMRKTLVFYKGRAPHGQKSDWIMHEYRLDDADHPTAAAAGDPHYPSPPLAIRGGAAAGEQEAQEEGWAICRMFKKKNLVLHHGQNSGSGATVAATVVSKMASVPSAMESSPTSNGSSSVTVSDHVKAAQMLHSGSNVDALDHILQYMGRSFGDNNKQDTKPPPALQMDHHHFAAACPSSGFYGKFMKLPPLEHDGSVLLPNPAATDAPGIADWDSLDRLAAYELNGISDASKNMVSFFDEPSAAATTGAFTSAYTSAGARDGDLWSLAQSSVSSLHADLTMNNV